MEAVLPMKNFASKAKALLCAFQGDLIKSPDSSMTYCHYAIFTDEANWSLET